ncbi:MULTISPECIES: D-alanyl-D-alanine carboxypeptidase family protein [Solibacillus]|uniref:D-alanyl-D-alanine carboxypeptidase n=1 Tax=Solibacillus merdavium TaxID=2762218 RepID=A0ABR8XJ43_9BACL|nr:D-alanyl-D-alanine carboxypeptidase family protein [Solibacillus merdavium]MBD8031946.1 D-alanyl-D-alanine carboxypeptidase [Solibacillus merdavium]
MKKWFVSIVMLFVFFSSTMQIEAAGNSYVVIDAENGRTLMGVNEHARLPIASLTKIWTALIVLENSELSDEVVISKEAAMVEGSSIYLLENETYTIDYLLHGLMMQSGNDAATALAEHVGGSVEGFVKLMNEKAQLYRLHETTFTNPTGLHNEAHLSSAYDTAKMLQIAMMNPQFKKIASTQNFSDGRQWKNKHRLMHEKIGAISGKTGYTKVAGRTLATFFERKQKSFVIVTINEGNDWNVHRNLADFIDKNFDRETIVKKGEYKANGLSIELDEPLQMLLHKKEKPNFQHIVKISRLKDSNRGVWLLYADDVLVASKLVTIR